MVKWKTVNRVAALATKWQYIDDIVTLEIRKAGDHMNAEFVFQVKDLLKGLFEVGDELDQKGLGRQMGLNDDDPMRDTIKAEILLFMFKVLDSDKMLNEEGVEYINDCLGYNFTQLSIEVARKNTLDKKYPQMSILLPTFTIIDSHLGGNNLSTIYVKTISFVTIGLLNAKGATLQETVNYCRRIRIYIDLVEKSLDCSLDFDPMRHIDSDNKTIIDAAIKIDKKIHPYEDEQNYLEASITAVKNAIMEDNRNKESNTRNRNEDISPKPENEKDDVTGEKKKIPAIRRLDQLIGLRGVKSQIRTILNVHIVNKKCEEYNIERQPIGMHMIFTGNPGTGKTTVARLVGEIFHEEGILSKGQFIEVSRSELVGKYVGHTARLVKEYVEKAKGGVLFIDEAYSLVGDGNDFGQEAIDTLVKEMEDNRDDLVIIAAGYQSLMQGFMEANPGIRSRFPITVEFQDYTAEELLQIFKIFCSENSINVSPVVLYRVKEAFRYEVGRHRQNFGNARMVRNLFEKMIMNQADRLVTGNKLGAEDVTKLMPEDLPDSVYNKGHRTTRTEDFHIVSDID